MSDWNDHYYYAEDDCSIKANGLLAVPLDMEDIAIYEIGSNINSEKLNISDIEQIEFNGW